MSVDVRARRRSRRSAGSGDPGADGGARRLGDDGVVVAHRSRRVGRVGRRADDDLIDLDAVFADLDADRVRAAVLEPHVARVAQPVRVALPAPALEARRRCCRSRDSRATRPSCPCDRSRSRRRRCCRRTARTASRSTWSWRSRACGARRGTACRRRPGTSRRSSRSGWPAARSRAAAPASGFDSLIPAAAVASADLAPRAVDVGWRDVGCVDHDVGGGAPPLPVPVTNDQIGPAVLPPLDTAVTLQK